MYLVTQLTFAVYFVHFLEVSQVSKPVTEKKTKYINIVYF